MSRFKQIASDKKHINCFGGALLEAAFSIPLLVLFCFGMVEIGSALSTAASVYQAAYLGASLGSDRDPSSGAPVAKIRVDDILSARNLSRLTIDPGQNSSTGSIQAVYLPASNPDSIEVSFSGELSALTTLFLQPVQLGISFRAPLLAENSSSVKFTSASNASECIYDCSGGCASATPVTDLDQCHGDESQEEPPKDKEEEKK